ncbi:hypothetical protein AZH53_10695 [Methanomicrobiaceae archaeon CYW5]|nr:hypothetical protein [Methanovulcanius yangii]
MVNGTGRGLHGALTCYQPDPVCSREYARIDIPDARSPVQGITLPGTAIEISNAEISPIPNYGTTMASPSSDVDPDESITRNGDRMDS